MTNLGQPLAMLMQRAEFLASSSALSQEQLGLAVRQLAHTDRALSQALHRQLASRRGAFKYRRQRKLIAASGLFDSAYYTTGCPELAESGPHPIDHYLSEGARAGINPHPLFDGNWYLQRNPDVAAKGVNPLEHFLRFGGKERRSPHPLFDCDLYLRLYPDVAAAGINPLVHYVRHGGAEGRRPHWLFDTAAYLDAFPELRGSKQSPLEHYCRYGLYLSHRPHRHFDPEFYLQGNAEVLSAGTNPLLHFLTRGAAEGRDPAPDFSISAYWSAHSEIRNSGENPLVHFASCADYRRVVLGLTDQEPPPPPVAQPIAAEPSEVLPPPQNPETPTQRLQDFLYDEFGLDERTRIVAGMQRFRLPLNPDLGLPRPTDDDLETLAGLVSSLAEAQPVPEVPDVSIVVPVFNQVRFTLACLYSILASKSKFTYEIIIADDCSSDATPAFFAQGLVNVRHVRSAANVGFLRNCNGAAAHAKGRTIVFLNNDTYVLPGWLDHLVKTLDGNPDVGLVGSKLIFADGRLQESGGLIFEDGSGWNYGRFDDPRKPEYCYLRDSDYVSGASIAISNQLWQALGGFDERYEMAYYEDTDLAFQVRAAGKRVVVQPLSQLIHFEGVTSGTDLSAGVKRYQVVNGETFRERWATMLAEHGTADPDRLPTHRGSRGTVLVIDARTPMPDRDSGSMDTYQYLRILKSFGYRVLFAPENLAYTGHYTASLQEFGVQTIYAPYWVSFDQLLLTLGASLDYVLIYRAPVAAALYDKVRELAPRARIIFDTVDLHFLRMEREAELACDVEKKAAAEEMKAVELDLIKKADASIVLSRFEMELVSKLVPDAPLYEIPIVREVPPPSANGFDQRRDVVFVGGFEHTPNVDAVKWFVAEVLPCLQSRGFTGQFVVVGSNMPQEIKSLAGPSVTIRGFVADLEEFFSEIRVSVAPLRYGAGLKGKVISSLSFGVPVVATTVAVEGGGFTDGADVLVADDPDRFAEALIGIYEDPVQWARLSARGYAFFTGHFSVEAVATKLATLLADLTTE